MIYIRPASQNDMPFIKQCIERFLLDDEDLDYHQFVVAMDDKEIAGFGRVRPHKEVYELSGVGVVEHKRNQGIGRMIVEYLISRFPTNEVYITTDIPEYFERFGFNKYRTGTTGISAKAGACLQIQVQRRSCGDGIQ